MVNAPSPTARILKYGCGYGRSNYSRLNIHVTSYTFYQRKQSQLIAIQ